VSLMGGFFPLTPTPLYAIALFCTDNIVCFFLVHCTNKNLLKKNLVYVSFGCKQNYVCGNHLESRPSGWTLEFWCVSKFLLNLRVR
jgi:hypothetical protein